MGSSSKRFKEKETNGSSSSRKRRHRSRSESHEREAPREKKHRHRRHHKEKKRDKHSKHEYVSDDSDVIDITSPERWTASTPPPPPSLSPEPKNGGGSAESLSIAETNKLRAKLGLKPLQVDDGSGSSSKKDDAGGSGDSKIKDDLGEFYHKPAIDLTQRAQQEKIRGRMSERKEKRHIDGKLSKVKLLADADSDDDAGAWINKSRRIENQKKEADKRAKALEELDRQFGIGEIVESEKRVRRNQTYTEKNLKGLQVDHNMDTFTENETIILTLKDSAVLDETDDVLINVNKIDDERYQKNIENKKKKSFYSNISEDLDEFGESSSKSLLSKYDTEIEGEKSQGFRIGLGALRPATPSYREAVKNKLVESLNSTSAKIASDYYNEEELAKFKKPRRKKVRKMRVKEDSIDDVPPLKPELVEEKMVFKEELEEEDTLRQALAKARRADRKRPSPSTEPETVAPEKIEEPEVDAGSNIVLNATAEFCRTLGDIPTYGKSGNREDSENLTDFEKDAKEHAEQMDLDDEESADEGGRWNEVDPNRVVKERKAPEAVIETPILDEEPDVSSGVGAALKLALSKGYLDKETNRRSSNSRLAHLQAQHYSIEDKSYGGDELDRGNRRERYSGPIMDFKEKDAFKPNVKLEYIDDDGHVLNAKEAFRYLSHKFHGKGPGKNKVEKRLKKSQQEGLMKKMSSTDTPLGTLNMLQSKQKEMQSPYIVLSGGKHTHSTTIAKARR